MKTKGRKILGSVRAAGQHGSWIWPGVTKKQEDGLFRKGDVVVGILTGHGLRDLEVAIHHSAQPIRIAPELDSLAGFFKREEEK